MIEKYTGRPGASKNYVVNDLEYLEYFYWIYDVLDEDGSTVSDEAKEQIRQIVSKTYLKGSRSISTDIEEVTKRSYEEGRSVGHSLGYKEGFDAGRVNRKQRLLNSFGGR